MINPRPRDGILDINPYKGGNNGSVENVDIINLASNESAYGPSPKVIDAYRDMFDDIHHYPDGSSFILRDAISKRYKINFDNILCGSGSDDLIDVLIRCFAGNGDEVLYSQYGFLMYKIVAKAAGAVPVPAKEYNFRTDIESILSKVSKKTKVVIIANPNNPTGSYLTLLELEYLCRELRKDILIIIDAAYAEYLSTDDYSSGISLVDRFQNVVMTRTFSKLYGLAALRIGWLYGPNEIIEVVNRVRLPFNVNSIAQLAGSIAIKDEDYENFVRSKNSEHLPVLTSGLRNLGYEVFPSAANFVLVNFFSALKASAAFNYLKSKNILVRNISAYGLPEFLRISVGKFDDIEKLLIELSEFEGNN